VIAPVSTPAPHFVLYSRSWCHLCEDMHGALRAFMARQGLPYTVDVVDVDADPVLVARFDELVPLLYADGAELCHYFLDEAALAGYLARIAGGSPSCSLDQEAADLR
jgi:thioredoxin-like negative regulator of GroEL